MAISPPSDIILDVSRAVEPEALAAARAKLTERAGAAANASAAPFSATAARNAAAMTRSAEPEAKPYQRFEAMVLQSFIENMLPDKTEAVYGKGMAGDMWKSMMAKELAGVMAERGGIGIADRMLTDHYVKDEKAVPVGPVSHNSVDAGREAMLSTAMVQKIQLDLARSLGAEQTAISAAPTS